jgi:hypothetical protein
MALAETAWGSGQCLINERELLGTSDLPTDQNPVGRAVPT